jgi:hypothetical protein
MKKGTGVKSRFGHLLSTSPLVNVTSCQRHLFLILAPDINSFLSPPRPLGGEGVGG